MRRKGFTLIELLAVIIILGILMLIAIPSVSNYINNSKKETYVSTVNELVKGVSTLVNSGELNALDTDTIYYIPLSAIKTEGSNSSPYGDFDDAYIGVVFDGENYQYYFAGKDTAGMGVNRLIKIEEFNSSMIESNINEDIDVSKLSDKVLKYQVLNDDLTIKEEGENTEAKTNISVIGNLGDYVKMTPTVTSFSVESDVSNTENPINPSRTNLWRIINIKKDGSVEMIAESSLQKVNLKYSEVGYNKLGLFMRTLGEQYMNDNYTISARIPGYNNQIDVLDSNLVNYTGSAPEHSTDGTSIEAKGEGDLNYLKDLELIENALGTITASDIYFLASRTVQYTYRYPNSKQWQWGGETVLSDFFVTGDGEKLRHFTLINICTNSCSYATGFTAAIRPIVELKQDLQIASGKGTKQSPYVLK